MNQRLPYIKVLLIIAALIFSLPSFAQLPAFNFSVSVTHQTCLNNGVLTFTTSGTQPGAGITFTVYKLPDTANYVIETTNTVVPGRSAGTYRIVATQSLNGQTSTNTQNAVIDNLITELNFGTTAQPALCGNDGIITVTVVAGFPSGYQITQGPVLRPLQTSNVFSGLPQGLYTVRVFDVCGQADVHEQLVGRNIPGLTIGEYGEIESITCGNVTVTQDIFVPTGTQTAFPVYIQITVFPPGGGAPVIINQVVNGGNQVPITLPYYVGTYSYNIKATDSCGNIYNKDNNVLVPLDKDIQLVVNQNQENCGDNVFTVSPANYLQPYTLSFPTAPSGFNPNINPQHPTFTSETVTYGGGIGGIYVPEGMYVVKIVDACGKTISVPFEVLDLPLVPIVQETDADCLNPSGILSISIPGRQIGVYRDDPRAKSTLHRSVSNKYDGHVKCPGRFTDKPCRSGAL